MNSKRAYSIRDLDIPCEAEVERITARLRGEVIGALRRRGFVVGMSGGIDSSVVAALCVRAVGRESVLGLLMPEREALPETTRLGHVVAQSLGIETIQVDITPMLQAVGCYEIRDRAIRKVIPSYGTGYVCKLVLPSVLENDAFRLYSIAVQSPDGGQEVKRLPKAAFMEIMAASTFKQRVRKMLEYHHADRLNYAVAGTPNRLEYELGFFVKNGDGAADTKPIAHLYKTQVYQLAEFLDVPQEIRERVPTTDTYSMTQSQEEFFFSVPYRTMDLCLYGRDHGVPLDQVAAATGLTTGDVERVYRDIDWKRRSSQYLHAAPVLIEEILERSSPSVRSG